VVASRSSQIRTFRAGTPLSCDVKVYPKFQYHYSAKSRRNVTWPAMPTSERTSKIRFDKNWPDPFRCMCIRQIFGPTHSVACVLVTHITLLSNHTYPYMCCLEQQECRYLVSPVLVLSVSTLGVWQAQHIHRVWGVTCA
jgi:hypothetical protein